MPGNRIRHLDALVGVDAWHRKPTAETKSMTLHVRLNFNEGRLGGGDEDNIQFKLRLKSAELQVTPTGPLKFQRSSALERTTVRTVRRTAHQSKLKTFGIGGKAEAGVGQCGILGKVTGNIIGQNKQTSAEDVSSDSEAYEIDVRIFSDNSGNPRWILNPHEPLSNPKGKLEKVLDGTPWDANNEPIIRMRDAREQVNKEDSPEIHITLKCRREDLHIFDIRFKSENGNWLKASDTDERKQLLALEFIKNIICEIGLPIDSSSSDHSTITLCDLYSEPIIDSEWDDDR